MTFLPIVSRELRVAARRRSTYWVRIGAAVAVLVLGTWFFLMMQHDSPPQEMSRVLFGIMTGGAVLYALLSGVRSTSDCLSEEKREGTFGLLFLTDLKGYDVVFGKLVATSLSAFYGVMAVVPILAIPLLMGGVTPSEFGRMALVAVNTMFFSLATGMVVSSMSRSGRKAAVTTFALVFFFTALIPFLGALVTYYWSARWLEPFFFVPSPGYTFAKAFEPLYALGKEGFWWSLGLVQAVGWIFLFLACVVAPRSWQDKPAGVKALRWRERWQLWSYGNLEERMAFRRRLLNQSAFYWLAARVRLKPAFVWAVLGIMACGWAWGLAKWHHDWLNTATYLITGLLLNILIKAWFATECGRQLADDRKQGALELLLATPLTVRDILQGQMLALRRQFLGPVVVTLVVFFLCIIGTLSDITEGDHARALWITLGGGAMVMMIADLVAIYWVGTWQAMVVRNPNRVANATLLRILLVPSLAWALFYLLMSMAIFFHEYDLGWEIPMGLWFGLGIAADIGFGALARHKLLTQFRLVAEQRYTPRAGFLKRLFAGSTATPAQR